MKIYTESVFTALLKIIGGGKFRRALRDAEKITDEAPGLKAEIQQFAKDSRELKDDMERFCKNYPESPLCSGKGKSSITNIEHY